ncbi:MAG: VWA domain-containing protein, partial [Flavobacteriales bacterium]
MGNLENERNTSNNQRQLAVEVIDEKTRVAIVSEITHPDLGALKKIIESNEQRSVKILKPNVNPSSLEEVDLFVLYQPTASFRSIYQYISQRKANTFTITGPRTDWNFINTAQNSFTYKSYYQAEEVTPKINRGFTYFNISDVSFEDYPPLENDLGEAIINKSHETLIAQRIKGMDMNEPMMALISSNAEREAVLFGENIWKWRMQSYRDTQSFDIFDDLMGKLVLFLTTNKPKNRFSVDYRSVYEGSSEAKLTAVYFDAAFIFDRNATILLQLKQKETGIRFEFPMLLKNDYYEADLTELSAGEFEFTASVENEDLQVSGNFT